MKWTLLAAAIAASIGAAQASEWTVEFTPVSDPTVTGYRIMLTDANNASWSIDISGPGYVLNDTGIARPYKLCIASTDGTNFSPCSYNVLVGGSLGRPQIQYPSTGWVTNGMYVFSKPAAVIQPYWDFESGQWIGPTWNLKGMTGNGVPTLSPVMSIGNTTYCEKLDYSAWGDALIRCVNNQ